MYTKGEVVWAKIKGFPWWPGVIAMVIDSKDNIDNVPEILVNFIGENSHAKLPLDKVAKFNEYFNEFSKIKKKKLTESIEIAERIISGKTTYEIESQKLELENKNKNTYKRKRDDISFDNSEDESIDSTLESPLPKKKDQPIKSNNSNTNSNNNAKSKKMLDLTPKNNSFMEAINNTTTTTLAITTTNNNNNNTIIETTLSEIEYNDTLQQNNDNPLKNVLNTKLNEANNNNIKKKLEYKMPKRKILKIEDQDEDIKSIEQDKIITENNSAKNHNNIHETITNLIVDKFGSIKKEAYEISNSPPSTQNALLYKAQTKFLNTNKMISDSKNIIDQIIDTILSLEASALNYANLEKSLKLILNDKINENFSTNDVIQKDIGKYIYTMINLIEVLEDTHQKANLKLALLNMQAYKNELQNILNKMKTSLINNYIEDKHYFNNYLLQLTQKRQENQMEQIKLMDHHISKDNNNLSNKFCANAISGDGDGGRNDGVSSGMNNVNVNINANVSVNANTSVNTNSNVQIIPQNMIDEVKAKTESSSLVNLSTYSNEIITENKNSDFNVEKTENIIKTQDQQQQQQQQQQEVIPMNQKVADTDNKSQKCDECKGDDNFINNPQLRKKICLKMSKIIGDKYNLEVKASRDLTIKIENKIRVLYPDMKQEYRDNILIILRLFKYGLINPDEFIKETQINFTELREKLEEYLNNKKQYNDKDNSFGHGLQDSPRVAIADLMNKSLGEDNNNTNNRCNNVNIMSDVV